MEQTEIAERTEKRLLTKNTHQFRYFRLFRYLFPTASRVFLFEIDDGRKRRVFDLNG